MKLLVLTPEPVSAQQLRDAAGDGADPDEIEVMVIVPALQQSGFQFWLCDADEAIAKADDVRKQTVSELDAAGVAASSDVGESDPVLALQDTLATFQADRIVVFTHPDSDLHYREQLDPSELEQRFGIPVQQATARR
jgi:hypothetical protein